MSLSQYSVVFSILFELTHLSFDYVGKRDDGFTALLGLS